MTTELQFDERFFFITNDLNSNRTIHFTATLFQDLWPLNVINAQQKKTPSRSTSICLKFHEEKNKFDNNNRSRSIWLLQRSLNV